MNYQLLSSIIINCHQLSLFIMITYPLFITPTNFLSFFRGIHGESRLGFRALRRKSTSGAEGARTRSIEYITRCTNYIKLIQITSCKPLNWSKSHLNYIKWDVVRWQKQTTFQLSARILGGLLEEHLYSPRAAWFYGGVQYGGND